MSRTVIIAVVCVSSSLVANAESNRPAETRTTAIAAPAARLDHAVAEAGRPDRYQDLDRRFSLLDPAARRPALELTEQLVGLIAGERSYDFNSRVGLAAGRAERFADELQTFTPEVAQRLQNALRSAETKSSYSSIFPQTALWVVVLMLCVAAAVFFLFRTYVFQGVEQ